MYGRYRTELFYGGEDYALQVDAHTRFVPFWDNLLIDMFEEADNENAVLTTYPKAWNYKVENWLPSISKKGVSVVAICGTKMLGSNMFKHWTGRYVRNPGKPVLAQFFAAGFAFSKGHKLVNVPSDPYLPYLFDGTFYLKLLVTLRLSMASLMNV